MFVYSCAWFLVLLLTSPWWLWKVATTDKYREGFWERLGRVSARLFAAKDSRPVIWVHAVSVGEVIAINGLVRELRLRAAGFRVVVSTTTRTGQTLARERFGANDVFYFPIDFAFAVRAYLRVLRPNMLVLAETEFWPRTLFECDRYGVICAVVNARISDRSYAKYVRLRVFWKRFLGIFALFCAQSEEDVSRLKAIGAPADRVRLVGNLKYDIRATSEASATVALRRALPSKAKLLVCGSTLEGEERLLLEAWPELVAAEPELRMVLAPRHPERFESVAHLLERSGTEWLRLSDWLVTAANAEPGWTLLPGPMLPGSILLLDSIGDLASVYSLATVAFVGGSLVAAGGHNPLEPAQFGVPILMGTHYENFREIVEKLRAAHAIRIVEAEALAASLIELLRDREAVLEVGARAEAVFAGEAGATTRTVDALLELLKGAAA